MEAYTYYRHGWQLARHWSKAHLLVARRLFAKATELDAGFAPAYAALALCDCYLLEWSATSHTRSSILATADMALALDPNLATAYVARGSVLHRSGRTDEAADAYARAMAIDPSCYEAKLFAGHLAWTQGNRLAAKARFIEAADLRREDYVAPYFVLGMIDKSAPDRLAWAQLALERIERAVTLQPENLAPLSRGAVTLVHLGKISQAASWIRRALTLDPEDPVTCYNAAAVYSLSGDQDTALQYLETSIHHSSEDAATFIRHDGDLDAVRRHPGYDALVATGWQTRSFELRIGAATDRFHNENER